MRKEISPPPILRSALLAGFVAAASFAASDASAATRTATEAFATNAAARAATAATNALAAVAHTGDYADLDNTPDIPPAPDYSTANAALVATIRDTAPAPGNYAAVSNAAMSAVQSETDPTVSAWAKAATKPTYTAAEVGALASETDPHALLRDAYSITTAGLITDWLINNNLYGGVRIRYSSRNLDNYTAYTYGGIAVRRDGATSDYLFDAAHTNGIVRRAELDAYQPKGDYITVENDPNFIYFVINGGTIEQLIRMGDNALFRFPEQDSLGKFDPDSFLSSGRILYPALLTLSGINNLANVVISATNATHQSLASEIASATNSLSQSAAAAHQSLASGFASSLASATNATLAAANAYADAAVAALPAPPTYAATNTTAVIAYNYGKETVAIPDGATLSADLSNWRDGEQCFVVLDPQGSYTPAASVAYNGYGLWPTNTALCVAWRYGATVYVNPVKIME